MKDNNNFSRELKTLVAFLASGAFAAVHKEFMVPSPEFSSIFPLANQIHHWVHFGIGVFLQLLLILWLGRITWHIWHIFRKQKPEEGSNKMNKVLAQSNESQDQLEHSESVNEKSAEPSSEKSTREQIEPPDRKKQDGSQ